MGWVILGFWERTFWYLEVPLCGRLGGIQSSVSSLRTSHWLSGAQEEAYSLEFIIIIINLIELSLGGSLDRRYDY